jgi:hypothetical protein
MSQSIGPITRSEDPNPAIAQGGGASARKLCELGRLGQDPVPHLPELRSWETREPGSGAATPTRRPRGSFIGIPSFVAGPG